MSDQRIVLGCFVLVLYAALVLAILVGALWLFGGWDGVGLP